MKVILLALGLIASGTLANAETISPREERNIRQLEPLEPRDESARLLRTTRQVIREPDGDRVEITRRIYENPAGTRTMRETRRPLDRGERNREGD